MRSVSTVMTSQQTFSKFIFVNCYYLQLNLLRIKCAGLSLTTAVLTKHMVSLRQSEHLQWKAQVERRLSFTTAVVQ